MSKQSDIVKVSQDAGTTGFVNTTGDTMTGSLTVAQGASLVKAFANNTEEYFVKGTDQSAYHPYISHTPSFDTPERGFRFGIWDNNGTKTDWLKIWNGHVTMPKQPAFRAVSSSSTFTPPTGPFTNVYDVAVENIGNYYNTATGAFTAPVSGMYFFYHQMSARTVSSATYEVKLYDQANSEIIRMFNNGAGYAHGTMASVTHYMNANDTVRAGCYNGPGVVMSGSADAFANYTSVSGWGGYLIG